MKNKKPIAKNPLQIMIQTKYRTLTTPTKKEKLERRWKKYKSIDKD